MNASKNKLSYQWQTASSGFTLIELMVTIAVLAIIVTIAAPSISTQLANQRVKSTTATLISALKEAKSESLIRRQQVTMSIDDSATNKIITLSDSIASYKYDTKSSISVVDEDDTAVTSANFSPSKTADKRTYTICDINTAVSVRQISVSAIGVITSKLGGTC